MTRPWLTERFCTDPNPHRPHPWPKDPDEDARWFCRGVQDVVLGPCWHGLDCDGLSEACFAAYVEVRR